MNKVNSDLVRDTMYNLNTSEIEDFVRTRLSDEFYKRIRGHVRDYEGVDNNFLKKQHLRFNMSGYGTENNSCYFNNLEILKLFADCGIWDYVTFLYLDAYKGSMTLYWQWFPNSFPTLEERKDSHIIDLNLDLNEEDFSGFTTSEIIARIIIILSKNPTQENWIKRRYF